MTHGEEPGSEMHQDSAVLTYLEGLLMHQVTGGPGATPTRRCEAGQSNQDVSNKTTRGCQLTNHAPSQERERRMLSAGVTQHPKKARLLRSEVWGEPETHQPQAFVSDLNGHDDDLHARALDDSAKCKGESTLLASLLQSFSSRLQSVALSQQIVQSLKEQDDAKGSEGTQEENEPTGHSYGTASNRLKGLLKKNKMQNHNSVPYQRRPSGERLSESPQAVHSSAQPPTSDSISCAARLKAVANLVNHRSSPAASPKPSVACSQLALLLSSEAHLQQYSREQALKAQLSGRSASERLAAMATQQTQDKKPAAVGQAQKAPDMVISLNARNGTQPQTSLGSIKQSTTLIKAQGRAAASPRMMQPFRERRPFDRHGSRPSQNCSSLLLQLLNNHNTQNRLNRQGHLRDDFSSLPERGSPMLSDSEYSNPDNSLPKDSSDAESSSSSCSPIDLSMRNKARGPTVVPSSSSSSSNLDTLTESLINSWKPEANPKPKADEARVLDSNAAMKPHHKVTLLQLLLGHKNNERPDLSPGNPDPQHTTSPKANNLPVGRLTPVGVDDETRIQSPQGGWYCRNLQPIKTFGQGRDSNGSASPYHPYSSPHAQSMPLNLCKSKSYTRESMNQEPAFSASKLLQNLAQCGLQSPASPPSLKAQGKAEQSHELSSDKPVTLLERLSAPLPRNITPVLDGTRGNSLKAPFVPEPSPPPSEIENLLEKRTVLQLLLGSATNKEKPSSKRKRTATRGSGSEMQLNKATNGVGANGHLFDVTIKAEPKETVRQSASEETSERVRSNGEVCESRSPVSLKLEPVSPEAVPKDGILSQLLKQQPRTFLNHSTTDGRVSVKEEPQEFHGPTVPKKRKFCLDSLSNGIQNPLCSGSKALQESSDHRRLEGLKDRNSASLAGLHGPVGCPMSKSPPGDSGGFNVLKQLLLSDNCLKELSQPRSLPSPLYSQATFKDTGLTGSEQVYNRELLGGLQMNRSPTGTGAPTPVINSPGSPWASHSVLQEHKRECDGPVRWGHCGDEKQDSTPPRLTKSNPILYYMLQKGNVHLGREARSQEVQSVQGGVQMKVKEEPVADMETSDHRLALKQQSLGHEVSVSGNNRLNGVLKKC